MISFKANVSLQDVEDSYVKMQSQRKNDYIDLGIPINLTFKSFAALTSFLQFVITWRKFPNSRKLIFTKRGEISDEDLNGTVKRFYGFVSSIVAWEKGVTDSNGTSLNKRFKPINSAFKDLLQRNELNKVAFGDTTLVPFFDHVPDSEGLFPILYKNLTLKDETEFLRLTEVLITNATKNSAYSKPTFDKIKADLNAIIFELFENTHKWARRSSTGSDVRPSVRGVFSKFFKFSSDNFSNYTAESTGLSKYMDGLDSIVQKNRSNKFILFLEISIFDSGSGLVEVYSRKGLETLSLNEEYKYLVNCLRKNNTSHQPIAENLQHGSGLHRIMKVLGDRRGFLRIRSGRMNLYRNFLSIPFIPRNGDELRANYTLIDWNSNTSHLSQWQRAEGTLITMIIPTIIEKT